MIIDGGGSSSPSHILRFCQILFHILVLLVIVIHVMCSGSK